MRLIQAEAKHAAFNGMSNTELIRHIEWEFPDLSGSLKLMLVRFEQKCGHCNFEEDCIPTDEVVIEDKLTCPKCGTVLDLKED